MRNEDGIEPGTDRFTNRMRKLTFNTHQKSTFAPTFLRWIHIFRQKITRFNLKNADTQNDRLLFSGRLGTWKGGSCFLSETLVMCGKV